MPPRKKQKDCLIILISIGGTGDVENIDEPTFLEKSKIAIKHLIQRKIFLRPKDEVGVIIIGAEETKNRLSFDNIVEMNALQMPTWDLIENIEKLEGTGERANWIDGLSLVIDYVNSECVDESALRTVVVFNDFKEESEIIEQYDIKTIVDEIQAAEINLLAIGNKSFNTDSQMELNASEEFFASVCKMVEGQSMTFEDTIPKLMIYKDKSKNPMAWRVDMDLFDIDIPILMYLKTTNDFKLPRWELYTNTEQDEDAKIPVERSRALVDRNKEEISQEDIITGNMYGRKFIPFSEEDKAALKYESGPKGFMIHGFTKRENVTMDCLAGKGSYIVMPAQGFASPFYSLVKTMADQNKVAIVRRVYQANTAPKIGVLSPKIDDPKQPWCLVYVELVYAEDRRIVNVKSMKTTLRELSKAQEAAVDQLIDAMMLMEVEDDSTNEKKELFKAGDVPDVSRQHVWDQLAHRALYPDSPLPEISDFLKKFLEPPISFRKKAKPAVNMIKELFPLPPRKKKKSRVKYCKIRDRNDPSNYYGEPADHISIEEPDRKKGESDSGDDDNPNDNNDQDIGREAEELAEIAQAVEAASQEMEEIDLEELAMEM